MALTRTPERENQYRWLTSIVTDELILVGGQGIDVSNLDKVKDRPVGVLGSSGARTLLREGCFPRIKPDSGVDVLFGIGGTPEGVLAACALRAMGGEIQGKLYARDEDELRRGREAGYDFEKVLTMDDLVSSEDVFFAATGITDGELLKGVRYFGNGASTDSIVVRGLTGTVRQIRATHRLDKLEELSTIKY